jgi:hypothetical protein
MHDCQRSVTETTIVDPKEPEDIRAFCCGDWMTLPAEQLPKQGLLTRLLA